MRSRRSVPHHHALFCEGDFGWMDHITASAQRFVSTESLPSLGLAARTVQTLHACRRLTLPLGALGEFLAQNLDLVGPTPRL